MQTSLCYINHIKFNPMKKTFISLLAILCICQHGHSQDTLKIIPKFLIDGYFFESKPEPFPEHFATAFPLLKDKDGNKVSCIKYPDGKHLSEWSKKRAIPFEKVKNGAELLNLASSAKYMKMAITGKPAVVKGDSFPAFKERDINGKVWNSKDLKGKYFLMNFWNTACGPCIGEMPALSKLKEKYPHILFFSATYNTAEQALPVIKRRNFSYIHLVETSDTLLKLVGGGGYPLTVIVDNTGKVMHVESGTSPKQLYDIEETLKKIPEL